MPALCHLSVHSFLGLSRSLLFFLEFWVYDAYDVIVFLVLVSYEPRRKGSGLGLLQNQNRLIARLNINIRFQSVVLFGLNNTFGSGCVICIHREDKPSEVDISVEILRRPYSA
jgi:hypothetical protein